MQKLKDYFGPKLQIDVPLRNYTTLKIGGPVKGLIIAQSRAELVQSVKLAHEENTPFFIIGSGSNLLAADEGADCLIIKDAVSGIVWDNSVLKVQSGTLLQELVNFSIQKGLGGLEKLSGIPGTVGGAIFGNAGAYGQSISDHLTSVVAFDGQKVLTFPKASCGFSYRHSFFKNNHLVILEIHFKLPLQNSQKLSEQSQKILQQRLVKYPQSLLCPGSFFKNVLVEEITPEILKLIPQEKIIFGKVPAGYLLESIGALGIKQGEIQVSPNHANLLVNLGQGKASDFYQLAKVLASKVKEKYGIKLEPEVQLLNLPPF